MHTGWEDGRMILWTAGYLTPRLLRAVTAGLVFCDLGLLPGRKHLATAA